MTTQAEAVYQVIVNVLLDNEIDFEDNQPVPAKTLISSQMKQKIRTIIVHGIESGEIYHSPEDRKRYDTPEKTYFYAAEIVGKALRYDPRLNGNKLYVSPEPEVRHDFTIEHYCRRLKEARVTGQNMSVIVLQKLIAERALELKAEKKQRAIIRLDEETIAQLPPNIRKMLGL